MTSRAAIALAALLAVACGDERPPKAQGAAMYKNVDEVAATADHWTGKTIKLHGSVVPGSIMRRPGDAQIRFQIEHGGATMAVELEGPPPDTFRDNAEVVITGSLASSGGALTFRGTEMMAKCPDGYTPPPG